MATTAEILDFLVPNAKWAVTGDSYEGITFYDDTKLTKTQFDSGITQYNAWKTEQDSKTASDKTTLLAKLGITADEAKLLLS
jgi:hypothetical protein